MKKKLSLTVITSLLAVFLISGCAEEHYYRQNNKHSEGYERRHHHDVPVRMDIDIHN